jgi:2-amino-4-hydroxy-6-hydroxymethyldihydropteridine diphosphokinase
MTPDPVNVAIALGSNLGDRAAHLTGAIDALREILDDICVSRFIETEPVGVEQQPHFLNAALTGRTALAAEQLLDALLKIERRFGRIRPHPGAPRTLDLDLILYGDAVIEREGLSVPHPRFRERRFVVEPLAEIAGSWTDPVTGKTTRELLREILEQR